MILPQNSRTVFQFLLRQTNYSSEFITVATAQECFGFISINDRSGGLLPSFNYILPFKSIDLRVNLT